MKKWQQEDPNYEAERQKYPHPVPSRSFILRIIKQSRKKVSFSALVKRLNLNSSEKETLYHRIKAMLRDGEIERQSNGNFKIVKVNPAIIGKVFSHYEGYGFFVANDKSLLNGEDLFLSYREMRSVMHGDIVEARVLKKHGKGKIEGKVIRVIERANKIIIGRLDEDEFEKKIIKAENRRIHQKIMVSNLNDIDAKHGHVVEVKITSFPKLNNTVIGEIIKVIGDKLNDGVEIDIAVANHNIPYEWPDSVTNQVMSIENVVSQDEVESRVDLRDVPFVTIDGITAEDFDDAVFSRKTPKGYLLYVAIADVSHYVEKDSPLDKEAEKRATSVYFPNKVIPMLPEKLSNGLCSLNPNVDRLCLVCEMLIDNDGDIRRSKFYEAVINSKSRLTYEIVESILFDNSEKIEKDKLFLLPHLQTLKDLYYILRGQSDRRGAIGFRTIEPEFKYCENGKISEIVPKKDLKSYRLIEEFMVRANVCAGKSLLKNKGKDRPIALFRNHLGPSKEKLENLISALSKEGIKINKTEALLPIQLADVIEKIKDLDNFIPLQTLVLRSMSQATYQNENKGHFGLSLDNYAHFTSPIRRYPDLLVHRAIKHSIKFKNKLYPYSSKRMQQLGEHCSMAERRADDAVYDVFGFLRCIYLSDKLGKNI